MQPGMPQGFGTVGPDGTPIFTLPGNPVSAYVSFCLFVRPGARCLQDIAAGNGLPPGRPCSPGQSRSPARQAVVPARRTRRAAGLVTPVSGQTSHQLASLARANALIIVPEEVTSLEAGETVDVLELP